MPKTVPVETPQERSKRAAFDWAWTLFKLNDVCSQKPQSWGICESAIFCCVEDLRDLQKQPQPVKQAVRELLHRMISEQGNVISPNATDDLLVVAYVFGECTAVDKTATILEWDRHKTIGALRTIVKNAFASGHTWQEFSAYLSQMGGVFEALKKAEAGSLPTLNRGEENTHA
ncbi:hypothetical protein ACOTHT_20040 [Achromobacter xylosoxidans]